MVLAVVVLAVVPGPAPVSAQAPVLAHGGDAPDGTNYRTAVISVSPAVPGLTVRAIEAGARLELVNRTGRTIEVLGYAGEPYLEIRPDGVFENVFSPATYLNTSLTGGTDPPASANPASPPQWRKASGGVVARWHDHRAHWMEPAPPPAVAADPGREHRVRDWVVPLRDELSTVEVTGTLDWVPPPAPTLWWVLTLLGAAAVALLGFAWARVGGGWPPAALAGVALVGAVVALVHAVGREIDAGSRGPGSVLSGLLVGQPWSLLSIAAALAAAIYTLRRRPAADLALGLAGACLALIAGAANAALFARSVAPVPWDPVFARAATAVVLAVGAGLAVAAGLRLRAVARATTPA